jgi:sRNA-binding carbon storage regulator CsrA
MLVLSRKHDERILVEDPQGAELMTIKPDLSNKDQPLLVARDHQADILLINHEVDLPTHDGSGNVIVKILQHQGTRVKLGISAPKNYNIKRLPAE